MTIKEIRELADAVAIIEGVTGERFMEHDAGDVLALLMRDGGSDPVSIACARIAIALGDDQPEFRAMIERGEDQ